MTDVKLGSLITKQQERDAVHIAVVPMIAGEELAAGKPFRLKVGTVDVALSGIYNTQSSQHEIQAIGVVDPFLSMNKMWVDPGERFWGLLYPGTVTSMRHHWSHPAFEHLPEPMSIHETWLREFADKWNFKFSELIAAGTGEGLDPNWRYVTAYGKDLHSAAELDDGDEDLFWHHLEAYTGKQFNQEHRRKMEWSCSC